LNIFNNQFSIVNHQFKGEVQDHEDPRVSGKRIIQEIQHPHS